MSSYDSMISRSMCVCVSMSVHMSKSVFPFLHMNVIKAKQIPTSIYKTRNIFYQDGKH